MLRKIISGGQTGVDQAALSLAREFGFEIGGWCPPNRLCENGTIPDDFPLILKINWFFFSYPKKV